MNKMSTRLILYLMTFAAVLPPTGAAAQEAPVVELGSRVKVQQLMPHIAGSRSNKRTLTGTVVDYELGVLTLRVEDPRDMSGERYSILTQQIGRIQVHAGSGAATVKGAAYGAVPGALFGGLAALTFADEGGCSTTFGGRLQGNCGKGFFEIIAPGILGGGAAGALLGAVIGSTITVPRWVSVNLTSIRFQEQPSIGAKVSILF